MDLPLSDCSIFSRIISTVHSTILFARWRTVVRLYAGHEAGGTSSKPTMATSFGMDKFNEKRITSMVVNAI